MQSAWCAPRTWQWSCGDRDEIALGSPLHLRGARLVLAKRDAEQIVTGVVLVPNKVDAQGDIISPEAIAKASFDFAQRYGTETQIGYMHKEFDKDLRMIESYIAPSEMNLDGYNVPKGSWVMSVKVIDKDVWSRVQQNEIRGFSIGGVAQSVREIEGVS